MKVKLHDLKVMKVYIKDAGGKQNSNPLKIRNIIHALTQHTKINLKCFTILNAIHDFANLNLKQNIIQKKKTDERSGKQMIHIW